MDTLPRSTSSDGVRGDANPEQALAATLALGSFD